MKNTVSIYACGGTGSNIALGLNDIPAEVSWIANRNVYFIDTSDANTRDSEISSDAVYRFPGTDGSGKERAENYRLIRQHLPEVMSKFPPSAFNILITSASGGSGAPIAHCIADHILKKGGFVIFFLVGTTGSEKEIENTLKSIKSLDSLATDMEVPVVCHYLQNQASASRKDINLCVQDAIVKLLVLLSGEVLELDTADLKNWLTNKAIGNELVSLHISDGLPNDYERAGHVVTVATLATEDINTDLKPVPVYQAVGIVDDAAYEVMRMPNDAAVNFMITPNSIVDVVGQINASLEEAKQHTRGRVKRASLTTADDDFGDDNILL
jgi:hypothetical protein